MPLVNLKQFRFRVWLRTYNVLGLFFLLISGGQMVAQPAATAIVKPATTGPSTRPVAPVQLIQLSFLDGKFDHLVIDPQKNRLYICCRTANVMAVTSLKPGRMDFQVTGLSRPQGLAVAPDINRLLLACSRSGGMVQFFDTTTAVQHLGSMELGDDSDNVRYEMDKKRFWIGNGDGQLTVLDALNGNRLVDIKLPVHPEAFQLEAKSNRVYVNLPLADKIAVVDREKHEVIETWDIKGANYPMALDEENHRLFIGCRKPAKLMVLDTANGKTIAELPGIGECDDIHYDPKAKNVYMTGDGGICVYKVGGLDQYTHIATVPVPGNACTSALDPTTGLLYLAVPHNNNQRPEIQVYDLRNIK